MTILKLKALGIAMIVTLIVLLCVMGGIEIYERIKQKRYEKEKAKAEASDSRIREMILKEIYRREIEITIKEPWRKQYPHALNTKYERFRLRHILKGERERQWQESIANKKEQEPKEILLKNLNGMDIRVEGQCSIAVKPRKDKPTS